MDRENESLRFMEALFKENQHDSLILLFNSSINFTPVAFKNINNASKYALKIDGNIYIACCLVENIKYKKRNKESNALYVPGVWTDIDFNEYKKTKKSPNVKEAASLIDEMPLKPTMIINSGHGYHAWWLFRELFKIESDEDRIKIKEIVYGWNILLRNKAKKHSWDIDNVGDLARILRLPGTYNLKNKNEPVICKINFLTDSLRYNHFDFDEYIPSKTIDEIELKEEAKRIKEKSTINISSPELNIDKLNASIANSVDFDQTYNRTRKDLKDKSDSGWDMALANQAALLGWSEKEIINLIIHNRKKHNGKKKYTNYYIKTALLAIENIKKIKNTEDKINKEEINKINKIIDQSSEVKCNELIDEISKKIGIKILRITRTNSINPIIIIETENSEVVYKKYEDFYSYSKFVMIFSKYTMHIPDIDKKQWKILLKEMLKIITLHYNVVDIGYESTDRKKIIYKLYRYTLDARKLIFYNTDDAAIMRPFIDDEYLCIHIEGFRRWIKIIYDEDIPFDEIKALIAEIGFEASAKEIMGSINNFWRIRILNFDKIKETIQP